MRKNILFFLLICLLSQTSFLSGKEKVLEEEKTHFNGIITYMGKVSRIPDRAKTKVKLNDMDAYYQLYMNDHFTKHVEDIEGQMQLTITEGITDEVYVQTMSSREGNILIEATPKEQKDYQLTAKSKRYSSVNIREVSGKKKIKGYNCKKVICDMITEDNIHVQLVAWYTPELTIKGYYTPYFGYLKGLPLYYDYYNGDYVVTYYSTKIEKKAVPDSFFNEPTGVEPINMTQYLRSQQQ